MLAHYKEATFYFSFLTRKIKRIKWQRIGTTQYCSSANSAKPHRPFLTLITKLSAFLFNFEPYFLLSIGMEEIISYHLPRMFVFLTGLRI